MKRVTAAEWDHLVATTPNATIEADEVFGVKFLMVGRRTIAVTTLGDAEAVASHG